MLYTNLVGYLHRAPDHTSYFEERFSLKMVAILEETGKNEPIATAEITTVAAVTEKNLAKSRQGDEEAEALFALASFAAHGSVPPDSLRHLGAAKNPQLRLMSQIYDGAKLTSDQVRDLEAKITDPDFAFRMALGQARQRAGILRPYQGVVSEGEIGALEVGMFLIGMATLLGICVLITYAAARASGHLKPLGHPAGTVTGGEADALGGMAALLLGGYLLIGTVITRMSGAFATRGPLMNAIPGVVAIGLTLIAWSIAPLRGRLGLKNMKLSHCVLWGVGAAVANLPIVFTVMILSLKLMPGLPMPEHPIENLLVGPRSGWMVLSLFFLASIEAPIFEETLFRGIFQPALAAIVKRPWLSGVITSFLFASIHPTGVPAWPALALIGGMSVFLTYQTRSIVPSMIMHATHNALTLAVGLLLT